MQGCINKAGHKRADMFRKMEADGKEHIRMLKAAVEDGVC